MCIYTYIYREGEIHILCVFICVYLYIYIYIYVCVCTYTYIYIYTCLKMRGRERERKRERERETRKEGQLDFERSMTFNPWRPITLNPRKFTRFHLPGFICPGSSKTPLSRLGCFLIHFVVHRLVWHVPNLDQHQYPSVFHVTCT